MDRRTHCKSRAHPILWGQLKINQIAVIVPTPDSKAIHSIEASIVRFMNRNTYFRTNKELTFRNRIHGGLGVPELKTHIEALQLGWMRRTFSTNCY